MNFFPTDRTQCERPGKHGHARRLSALLALLIAVTVLVACGSHTKTAAASKSTRSTASIVRPSPSVTNGQGSKTVPPPGGGNITQTARAEVAATQTAVPLLASAHPGAGVVVTLAKILAVSVTAGAPGEVAGASLAVTVHVVNGSPRPIDLASAVVTLLDAKGDVGSPTPVSPAAPFTGLLQPKAAADGVYVFNVPKAERNPVSVYVTYSAGAPTAHFVGKAS